MTKTEFMKRWAKKATDGGAVETFENDVEKLSRSLVMASSSAIINGLFAAVESLPKKDRERFRKMIGEVAPAIQRALAKLYQ